MNNEDQQQFFLGAKKDKRDNRDYRIAGVMAPTAIEKQTFNLEEKFIPNNQGKRGSCTSQAQVHHKERQEGLELSARFIMAKTKELEGNTDYGAYTRNTFKIVNKIGAIPESTYPEPGIDMTWEEYINVSKFPLAIDIDGVAAEHKSKSYWRVNDNVDMIRQVLTQYKNSVVISMKWYREFNRPDANGYLLFGYKDYVGGHAVEIKGFDDFAECFIIKNSWGPTWGKDGYFKMSYLMFYDLILDCWCSLDLPKEMAVDKFYGQKRTWISYLREKAVAFNPWLIGKIGRLPNNREIKGLAYGFWEFEAIFHGKYGDIWLNHTKPEAKKKRINLNN